jgi:DNA-binding CsgD family transcriptional regulator
LKKIFLTFYTLIIVQALWSQVEIHSSRHNIYENEIFDIAVTVPGEDKQAPFKLIINGPEYTILETIVVERFNYNAVAEKGSNSIVYELSVIMEEAGEALVSAMVNNEESEQISLNVIPLSLSGKPLPWFSSDVSSNRIYAGEKGILTNRVFSTKYMRDGEYVRPLMEMEAEALETPRISKLLINDKMVQHKIVSAFTFVSAEPGFYQIPESVVRVEGLDYPVPPQTIEVMELPEKVDETFLIGKSLNIEIEGLNQIYKNGDPINFSINLTGNVNLSKTLTLSDYFNIPDFLTEDLNSQRVYYVDGEMRHNLRFNYSGSVNSIIGFTLSRIKVPFFNTATGEIEFFIIGKQKIQGNFPVLLLYTVIIIILIIAIAIILLTLYLLRKNPIEKDREPVGKFNFSKRENEIVLILINGKSNKEIAEELFISPETVKKHIQNIFKKTNTNSRLELLALINSVK